MTDHHMDDSELLCREVLESLPDPCVVLEPIRGSDGSITNFRYVQANPAAYEAVGRDPEDFVGNTFHNVHPAGSADALFAALCAVVTTGRALVLADWSPLGTDESSTRHFEVRASLVHGRVSEV